MFLIVAPGVTGQVALNATMVNGLPVPARKYNIVGGFIVVDAGHEWITVHDAQEILKIPGYRLATSEESDSYNAAQQKKTSVRESKAAAKAEAKADVEVKVEVKADKAQTINGG